MDVPFYGMDLIRRIRRAFADGYQDPILMTKFLREAAVGRIRYDRFYYPPEVERIHERVQGYKGTFRTLYELGLRCSPMRYEVMRASIEYLRSQ